MSEYLAKSMGQATFLAFLRMFFCTERTFVTLTSIQKFSLEFDELTHMQSVKGAQVTQKNLVW